MDFIFGLVYIVAVLNMKDTHIISFICPKYSLSVPFYTTSLFTQEHQPLPPPPTAVEHYILFCSVIGLIGCHLLAVCVSVYVRERRAAASHFGALSTNS